MTKQLSLPIRRYRGLLLFTAVPAFLWLCCIAYSATAQTNTFPASGNVGIGTTNPNFTLQLYSTRPVISLNSSDQYPVGALRGNNGIWLVGYSGVSGAEKISLGSRHGVADDRTISLSAGGFERLAILSNGNIGIGTSSPTTRLSVNGNIRTKEVKVETANWPDYVFDEGYELPDLNELSAYIREHRHLPEIPPAADIERDGLDLAEMNLLLLKKVEELTLHLIEKDKVISGLQDRLHQLEAAVGQLLAK